MAFVWRYALGWRAPALVEEPLSLDERAWGELVHELLRRAVDQLEPTPGFSRADDEAVVHALGVAAAELMEEWPVARPVPPQVLWKHTLKRAERLAYRALRMDTALQPGTRCWTEVPFGVDEVAGDSPWNAVAAVTLPGTSISLTGAVDRLDLNRPGTSARVTDYKTGAQPPKADQAVISGGASLQRVIYAAAATQLLPNVRRVVARLFYLDQEAPASLELADVDQAVRDVGAYVHDACALLNRGYALPGLVHEAYDDYRLAFPADLPRYDALKRNALSRALGTHVRVWSSR